MTARPAYPFEPRSNARLEPGQLWSVPLPDGRFACGRVLAVPREPDPAYPVNTRAFLAGLMRWVDSQPPTPERIAGAPLLAQGFAHVLAIQESGGSILGIRPLEADGLRPFLWRSPAAAAAQSWVYEGARRLRVATADDAALPVIVAWGFRYISHLAADVFGAHGARRGAQDA